MAEGRALARCLVVRPREMNMDNKTALSEKEVLELVQKGDKEAYQIIVLRYMQTAYYIALGFVHNQEDARDLSQETFIRAFRKIKKFDR